MNEPLLPDPWEMVIGLEVHARILAKTKLFSRAPTTFGEEPNSCVSLVDAAMPGMLPCLNAFCVFQAARAGKAVNGEIQEYSAFDRKNYFYPDLPQGYQISQHFHPLVRCGSVTIAPDDGSPEFTVGIGQIHLEQDAGKLLHDQFPDSSLVDLNRSGSALIEIVSDPDLRTPDQASLYLQYLRDLLRWIDVCDGNMQEGSLRADVNISVRRRGQESLGTRTEIKNLNSVRFMRQAIVFEARRQVELLVDGQCVVQETRLYDPQQGCTRSLRQKEDAQDYRYFPDPDLLPVFLSKEVIQSLPLPELPNARKRRFIEEYALTIADAVLLVTDRTTADFFESAVHHLAEKSLAPKLASWMVTVLFALWKQHDQQAHNSQISAKNFAHLVSLVGQKKITDQSGKDTLDAMVTSGEDADSVIKRLGLGHVADHDAVAVHVRGVVKDSPEQVEQYLQGKTAVFGWLVGQVMKRTKGLAQPSDIHNLLRQELGDSSQSNNANNANTTEVGTSKKTQENH